MKFYAHRAGDLEHLKRLNPSVTAEELSFVLLHLEQLESAGHGNSHRIKMSRIIIQSWVV